MRPPATAAAAAVSPASAGPVDEDDEDDAASASERGVEDELAEAEAKTCAEAEDCWSCAALKEVGGAAGEAPPAGELEGPAAAAAAAS